MKWMIKKFKHNKVHLKMAELFLPIISRWPQWLILLKDPFGFILKRVSRKCEYSYLRNIHIKNYSFGILNGFQLNLFFFRKNISAWGLIWTLPSEKIHSIVSKIEQNSVMTTERNPLLNPAGRLKKRTRQA